MVDEAPLEDGLDHGLAQLGGRVDDLLHARVADNVLDQGPGGKNLIYGAPTRKYDA